MNRETSTTLRARVVAPAKVNPTLRVLCRRADGYHEVDTTLVALELCDDVEVRVARGPVSPTPGGLAGPAADRIAVEVSGPEASPDVPRDGRNLAVRALDAAREALAGAPGLDWLREAALSLELVKRIPSQAGLGGGSSDAAAAVHALERAVEASLAPAERSALLARLGADCVFFDAARATGAGRARGLGERVEALPAPRGWHIALVTPEVRCPTGAVYGALRRPSAATDQGAAPVVAGGPWAGGGPGGRVGLEPAAVLALGARDARAHLVNDLEAAAVAAVPALAPWRALLDELGATEPAYRTFRLSGSGSSWFGLAATADEAEALRRGLVVAAAARGLALRGAWTTRPYRRPSADAGSASE